MFNALSRNLVWDEELVLHDGGEVTTSDIGQYNSADRIVDLGAENISSAAVQPGGADAEGYMMIDASAVKVSAGNEIYTVHLQGSASSTFASGIYTLGAFILGDAAALVGDTDVTIGQWLMPFKLWQLSSGPLRYVRCYFQNAGTSPSITSVVRLGMR